MIYILVIHKEYNTLGLENANAKLIDFCDHWDQKSIQGLIHEALNIAQLLITFFFDVVLHFMGD